MAKYYYVDKDKRAKKAMLWKESCKHKFKRLILHSLENSTIYKDDIDISESEENVNFNVDFDINDTVSEIIKLRSEFPDKKICALNFASYKNPGGMFLKGSSAQEECLCHHSILYNVLQNFEASYYVPNRQDKNFSLYRDTMIYSKDIAFIEHPEIKDVRKVYRCDIITCAAPNRTAAIKYHSVPEEEIEKVMRSRIRFILKAAYKEEVEVLILGAFGCGVFGNKVEVVAKIFAEELWKTYGTNKLQKVVFAIPKMSDDDDTIVRFQEAFLNS